MSRIVERNETVMEKIVNTEEKLCQKWMFRNLLAHTANQILQNLSQHSPLARQCAMLSALTMLIPKFSIIIDWKEAHGGMMSITGVDSLCVYILVRRHFVKYSCIQKYLIIVKTNTECVPFA